MKIKLFAKEKPGLVSAIDFLKKYTEDIDIYIGVVGSQFPREALTTECDLLISYLSPWIIPKEALRKVRGYAINFHPGPPEYPGIGCTNFALYDQVKTFGVTCHIMEATVDTGKIIDVRRFEVLEEDSIVSLTERCYNNILLQFYSVVKSIIEDKVEFSKEKWTRKPFKRAELDRMCEITLEMSKNEIEKRIRAFYFPGMPGPFIKLYNFKFVYTPEL